MPRLRHLRIRYLLGFLLLGLLVSLGFGIANAQTESATTETPNREVIQNYESKIKVRQDGRLKVTETITVFNAEGGEIQRGIYRYFPNPDFKVTSVKRDGNRATYRTEINEGRKCIEIWKQDVYLDPGSYTYQIQYLTDQQIEDKGSQDQLYWNVTGQNWAFPIQQVKAEVILPKQIPSNGITLNAFTGYEGEKGQSYQAQLDRNRAKFSTTRNLKKREGLSVIVNFPQGYIEASNPLNLTVFEAISDHLTISLLLLAILAAGGSYLSYCRAKQVAHNLPLYLVPGVQSRVRVGWGRSGNSNSAIFRWVFLGSSLAVLVVVIVGIILFLSNWIVNLSNFIGTILVIPPLLIVFGFILASLLDGKFSNLRPRWNPNENRPMKCIDPENVDYFLNETEKQTAWNLGSIEVEGWYSPENPSTVHLRIYDVPNQYSYCPNCQEDIAYIAQKIVTKESTTRSEGVRLVTYKCHCCDYKYEVRERIPRKGSSAAGGGAAGGGAGGGGG